VLIYPCPQQNTWPSAVCPQVWPVPAIISVKLTVRTVRLVVVLFPSELAATVMTPGLSVLTATASGSTDTHPA
jgi:hypothetical protein